MKKKMFVNTAVQSGPCVKCSILGEKGLTFSYILSGYLKIFKNTDTFCIIYLKYHSSYAKSVLRLASNLKKPAYINIACTKSASKNSPN